MADLKPSKLFFLRGHVYHSRCETSANSFRYPILNVYFPLSALQELRTTFEKKFLGLLSLKSSDYLNKNDNDLSEEIKKIVEEKFGYKINDTQNIFLQTLPKMLGYVFNPVSFWYFFAGANKLEAVLCEVNNTFGEKHYYWLYKDGDDLNSKWLEAHKEFHVSPFFDLQGLYKFKFLLNAYQVEAHINFVNSDGTGRLVTWVKGNLEPVEHISLSEILLKYGWITPMVILRIHFQAVKLFFKKVKFYKKPELPTKDVTYARTINRR